MRLDNFVAEDYFSMDRDERIGLESWIGKNIPLALLQLEKKGIVRTVRDGDKVYAIYGLVEMWDGVGEVFFIPAKDWTVKKKEICKYVKKDLDMVVKLFNRVQMTCLEGKEFLRFAEFFGFKKEGVLKKYDRFKRDYVMLSITGGNI